MPDLYKPMLVGMQRMLAVASILVLIIGLYLMIFSEETEIYFSWTISVPLTSTFMGAAYFAAFFLEMMASRHKAWSSGRIAVPAVLLFTILTLIVTLVHLDRFHLGSQYQLVTQVITWFWLFIYVSVPIIMGTLYFLQIRKPGADLPRTHPMPAIVRIIFVIYTLILVLLGIGMLLAPDSVRTIWPWALTPLTARIVGAWMVGLGTLTGHTVIENDWKRVLPVMPTLAVGAALEIVMAYRYSAVVDWSAPSSTIYIGILGTMVLVGIYGIWQGVRAR